MYRVFLNIRIPFVWKKISLEKKRQFQSLWLYQNSAEGDVAPAGASQRTWLLNKFISFLAVLSWKSDKNKRQGLYDDRNFIGSICIFSYDAREIGLKKYPQSVHFLTIRGSENNKVKVEKVTKINLKIISKLCALLLTWEKTCAKFQKDWFKIV